MDGDSYSKCANTAAVSSVREESGGEKINSAFLLTVNPIQMLQQAGYSGSRPV